MHWSLNQIKSQKGAMFGLDARIALGVFGILSAIGGYAFVNVILDSKVNALKSEMDGISKGYGEYMLQNGEDTSTFSDLLPYITMDSTDHPTWGTMALYLGLHSTNAAPPTACTTGSTCSVWVTIDEVTDEVRDNLDTSVDGGQGATSGSLRYVDDGADTNTLYFKLARKMND